MTVNAICPGYVATKMVMAIKPEVLETILHCHRDVTTTVDKVRGFTAGVEQLFDKELPVISNSAPAAEGGGCSSSGCAAPAAGLGERRCAARLPETLN